ncbi:10520_t:CDS:2, partial [Gigaspora rosea]
EQTNQRRQRDASTHRRHRVEEHEEQRLNRRQQNATAKRQRRDEKTEDQPRGFSKNANINYPILHKIDITSSVTCNYCNALKLPMESPGICYSNGNVILAEPNQRTHNAPSSSEVAAIWVENDTPPGVIQERDIILRTYMNQLLRWAPRRIPYRNIPFSNKSIDIDESPNNESIEIDESPNNESIDINENPNNDRNDNELE